MPPRTTIVEEFDDDTELPLPAQPLPNHGPILQELDLSSEMEPLKASPSARQANSHASNTPDGGSHRYAITDITPYKTWTCIYPIYIDAKRPYGTGERRLPREKSVWWPLSKDIADAASRLGLGVLHEVHKSHPRDWENPGRVRVQWKKEGKLVNPGIKTKKQLLEIISLQIQRSKPDNIPQPPFTGRRLPNPPDPQPPLTSRLSVYSPALPSGVLVETVKAGMNAQECGSGAPPGIAGGGGGKGKRKVVRVRG